MKTIASLFWITTMLAACSSSSDATDAPDEPTPEAGAGTGTGDGSVPPTGPKDDASTPVQDAAPASCSAAEETLLKPLATVSTAEVTVLSDTAGTKTLFVDASAGGPQGAATNPRVYLDLAAGARVDVSDKAAKTATSWDLAVERPILFTNSGHGGAGQGGAVFLAGKAFDAVTAADAASATFAAESFFDAECVAKVDATGAVKTSFDGWYDYDTATNQLSPKAGTWLVKGASGKVFKVAILSYYATPDGGAGQAGGRYTMKVGAL